MNQASCPTSGSNKFVLKRWQRYNIYAKSGSYVRTTFIKSGSYGWDGTANTTASVRTNTPVNGTFFRESNPLGDNLYQTSSIYLYDYVCVSDVFFYNNVYTASTVDSTPSFDSDWVSGNTWMHRQWTFKNTPNSIRNDFQLTYDAVLSTVYGHPYYTSPYILDKQGQYFEIVQGYPRNHFTHKRNLFGLYRLTTFGTENGIVTQGTYRRNSQTITTTIGTDGLEDGSPPFQSTIVGNLNLVQTDNVINQ
jgi:hypothetical protein